MSLLFCVRFAGLQLTEKGVEALEVALPNPPVALQPNFKFPEGRGAQGIDAALSVNANVDESGVTEDAQVFGNLRLAKAQAADQVADGARTATQKFDDVKAVGLGERPEGCQHGDLNMPQFAYSCQGIFTARNI
jgi:hypothetical protein